METKAQVGRGAQIDQPDLVGYVHDEEAAAAVIGTDATIRSGTTVYTGVDIGDDLTTGHDALIREGSTIGDDVTIGSRVVIDGHVTIGSNVSIQSGVYIPPASTIGDDVFLGPYSVLTNDPYPVRMDTPLAGPTIQDGVSIGANSTILPDIQIGENAFVAAGAVVTDDVPSDRLALGAPATVQALPDQLRQRNRI